MANIHDIFEIVVVEEFQIQCPGYESYFRVISAVWLSRLRLRFPQIKHTVEPTQESKDEEVDCDKCLGSEKYF